MPKSDLASEIVDVGIVTAKKATLEIPPPGLGLNTVIDAVLNLAMSEAGTLAFNCESLTNAVASALPSSADAFVFS